MVDSERVGIFDCGLTFELLLGLPLFLCFLSLTFVKVLVLEASALLVDSDVGVFDCAGLIFESLILFLALLLWFLSFVESLLVISDGVCVFSCGLTVEPQLLLLASHTGFGDVNMQDFYGSDLFM